MSASPMIWVIKVHTVGVPFQTALIYKYSNDSAAGRQIGYATLDSIRAALKSTDITGLSANATVTMNGYSAGALSVGWVSLDSQCSF
jgi:hypothetical protein